MHKKLIMLAFEKAIEIRVNKGEKKPSLINVAEDLSDSVYTFSDFKLGERSFRDYRNEVKKLTDINSDINIRQLKVINGLCHYLGFDDYEDFILKNKKDVGNKPTIKVKDKSVIVKSTPSWIKIIISISVSIACLVVLFVYLNKPRFMVWQENHYLEVSFDTNRYDLSQLKRYKKERILNFKRIIPECDSTIFFNENRNAKLWYGKNTKGKIEYFTDVGLHPETGKTLKGVTTYIIDKYICIED